MTVENFKWRITTINNDGNEMKVYFAYSRQMLEIACADYAEKAHPNNPVFLKIERIS